MAETIKVLAQSLPPAATLTDVYTASVSAVISSIVLANQASSATTVRLSAAVAGAADAAKQYLYYDVPVPANDSLVLTLGITLAATDVLRAYSANGAVSVNVFGVEAS